uniref:Uncharacterized protein n=1 Tax=uncultured marine virus TaxID=186617 RepID=A0A0F7L4H6_9VIRU|nr:hypothetical protein [uncultured marine virus]
MHKTISFRAINLHLSAVFQRHHAIVWCFGLCFLSTRALLLGFSPSLINNFWSLCLGWSLSATCSVTAIIRSLERCCFLFFA